MKYTLFIPALAMMLATNICAANNQQVSTPESILPAGVDETIVVNPYTGDSGQARKGTVAAAINNIAVLNKLLLKPQAEIDNKNIETIIKQINLLIPSLKVLGLFDFFTVNEWLANDDVQPGRALTAVLYLKQYPAEMNPATQKLLNDIYQNTKALPLKHNIDALLPK